MTNKPDFKALFEAAPGRYLVLLPDAPRFTILAVSDAYAQATMTRREGLLGRSLFDVFPGDPDDLAAGGIHHLHESLTRAIASGLPDAMAVQKYSVRRPDSEGGGVEERWWSLSNTPVLDTEGQVRYLIHRVEEVRPEAQQLESHVRQRTEQLRRLGADLEAAQERERRKIAHDLHDDLGQTLAAARIWLSSLCTNPQTEVSQPANEVDKLLDHANRSTRSLAAQLAPAMLYELGLCPTLEWLGEDIGKTYGLKITVTDDGQPKPLSQNARSILYRATRELLINAAKHARSPSVDVHTSRNGDRIVVRVSDAGVGFDAAQVSASSQRGMGLVSVRERLSYIGGTAEIRSIPGKGTEAVLSAMLEVTLN